MLCALGACAHPASTQVPAAAPADWIDDPLLGATPQEVERLDALAAGDPRARQVRLDRLLDLFDAARFGQDDDARETLWDGLGGHPTGVGDRASREAIERMLGEALALEEAAQRAAQPGVASYAADAIMLLTTDLQTPGTAEDLSIRTLVYRTLVEQGHPRLADNARWRLYDHVRGTLDGALQSAPEHRMEVAVQALYADRESVEPLLADTSPHARPPWPAVETLWTLVEAQRAPLADDPRWASVLQRRDDDDHRLADTLRTVLPATRRDDWPLTTLAAGTARAESLAPVVRVDAGRMTVDAGRTHARGLALDADIVELSRAVGNAMAQDGRGTLLLVADPMLPAPQVHTILRTLFRAHAERVEIAVREPRLDPEAGEVVMALPLYVTHAGGTRPGDLAWAQARVHVHLDGRGPQIAIEERWLDERPTSPRQLQALVQQVARAYPRERGVRISLGSDVQLQQIIELLAALQGGPERPFAAVGWSADGSRPGPSSADAEAWLQRRLALTWEHPQARIEQPYPLEEQDQKRLEGFAEALAVCLPELQVNPAPASVTLRLSFEEGRLRHTAVDLGRRVPEKRTKPVVRCAAEEGYAVRLRGHREAIEVVVTLSPGAGTFTP